jgi:nitrate/nitrite transporter NarK
MFTQAIQPYFSQALGRMFGMFGSFGAPGGMMPPPVGQPGQAPPSAGQPSVALPGSKQISDKEMEDVFNDK